MSSPVLLILGAGPNIGAHLTKTFAAQGYRVAMSSRQNRSSDANQFFVPVDLNKPEDIPGVFDQVKAEFGVAPSVVVHNAAFAPPDEASDPLSSVSVANLQQSFNINATSVVIALQQAVAGFRTLPASASKTFIFTGNILNRVTMPLFLSFGLGKSAGAYAIQNLVEHKLYEKEGISFYFADERTPEGKPVGMKVDGPGAAEEYWNLVERKDQGPWLYSFVKGQGYVDFEASK